MPWAICWTGWVRVIAVPASRSASGATAVAGCGWKAMPSVCRAGAGAVLALRDITARKEGEAVLEEANSLLRRRACEDPATGLANRGHFVASLERELRRARRDGNGLSLIVAEMDGFGLFRGLLRPRRSGRNRLQDRRRGSRRHAAAG